jgi:hypothetical protein
MSELLNEAHHLESICAKQWDLATV